MAKVTISISELPDVSQDSLSHLQFRIIDENRKLFSAESVIAAIKRPSFEYIADNYNNIFRSTLTTQRIDLTWYTPDISQKFEVYGRYKYINSSSATYWDEPVYFGSAQINTFSFIPTPNSKTATDILTSQAIQALVKIPTYSSIVYNKLSITNLNRSGTSTATYTTSTDHNLLAGDTVSIYLNKSASTVFDTFAGYFTVASVPTSTTFTCDTGISTTYVGAPPSGSLTNYAQKVSGKIHFLTSKINFI